MLVVRAASMLCPGTRFIVRDCTVGGAVQALCRQGDGTARGPLEAAARTYTWRATA